MTDLSNWDFASSFTAMQIALLIEGKNASFCEAEGYGDTYQQSASTVILGRMSSDFTATWSAYAFSDFVDGPRELLPWENILPSLQMNRMAKNCFEFGKKAEFEKWLIDGDKTNFYKQNFERKDIQYWIDINKFPSKYVFEKKAALETKEPTANKVPTFVEKTIASREHTSYLNIIGAMLEQLTAGAANDTTVILQAVEAHKNKYGVSERKLQEVFAAAKRSLGAS